MMAEISEKLQQRLDEIRTDCKTVGKGMRGTDQLRWMFSREAGGASKPGKFDVDGLRELFDRAALEASLKQAKTSGGTRGDVAIAKAQSDILSGMERDLHQRRRSRIRMLAHEATARSHVGSARGVLQSGVMAYFETQVRRNSEDGSDDGNE